MWHRQMTLLFPLHTAQPFCLLLYGAWQKRNLYCSGPRSTSDVTNNTKHGCTTFWLAWTALSEWESYRAAYTNVAPKVMPPNYFHRNDNRYKEQNNTT